MEHSGKLITDVSFLNEFKVFQDAKVTEMYNQKLVLTRPEQRKDVVIPS